MTNIDLHAFAHAKISKALDDVTNAIYTAAGTMNAEVVHKLRVSIRRFAQAVRVFRKYVPREQAQRITKRLRKVMKAAGEVRDRDILIGIMEDFGIATAELEAQREKARRTLGEMARVIQRAGIARRWRSRLLEPTPKERGGEQTATAKARSTLPKRFRKYLALGQAAFARKNTWDDLHAFRIQTKRMRYTLELFAELYGPQFEQLIDRVRKVQTLLGEINDLVSARRLLKQIDGGEQLRKQCQARADRKLGKARTHWRTEFDAAKSARSLRYLKTQARARRAA